MEKNNEVGAAIAHQDNANVGRRNVLKMTATGIAALGVGAVATGPAAAQTRLTLTDKWDKTFPKSNKVDHKKVTFKNRYGIELAADMAARRAR